MNHGARHLNINELHALHSFIIPLPLQHNLRKLAVRRCSDCTISNARCRHARKRMKFDIQRPTFQKSFIILLPAATQRAAEKRREDCGIGSPPLAHSSARVCSRINTGAGIPLTKSDWIAEGKRAGSRFQKAACTAHLKPSSSSYTPSLIECIAPPSSFIKGSEGEGRDAPRSSSLDGTGPHGPGSSTQGPKLNRSASAS